MINSILDTDLYTFTVGQAIAQLYPDSISEYSFKSRKSTPVNEAFVILLMNKIERLSELKLNKAESSYLSRLGYFNPTYISYLENYRFNPKQVKISYNKDKPIDLADNFNLDIAGPWMDTIFWEVPLLALISETYYEIVDTKWDDSDQISKIIQKGNLLSNSWCKFADFGTRRRRNFDTQKMVVDNLKFYDHFVGTSNVQLAMEYGVDAIGTMSHQWIMGISALESLLHANRFALQNWNKVYNGKLGIYLPDTFGTQAFLEDFDTNFARIFDGVRQDSGNPFNFSTDIVNHYHKLGIDHSNKTIVFSDSLDCYKTFAINGHCKQLGIKCSFGIGTHFTNDFSTPALNIVIKLKSIKANSQSKKIQVVKLSDDIGKATGDKKALEIAKWTFE